MKLENIFAKVRKAEVVSQVAEGVTPSYQYLTLLVLSVVIATLGLLIENSAIIIGAMILSPIIWPILGLSMATVKSKRNLFVNSLTLLIFSIVLSIVVAFIISLMSPLKGINGEIALRINPTFYDLIIALAAGIAASLVLAWPRFSTHIAGVAVAASVLPPICVTGIGLAFSDPKVAYGSFVLFITNLSSIIFAGIAVFALIGFYKADDKENVRRIETGLIFSFLVILFLSFQLLYSLNQIIYEDKIKSRIKNILVSEFAEISSDIKVNTVNVGTLASRKEAIDISAGIEVPSDINIDITEKNRIVEVLDEKLKRETNLELRVIPILKVVAKVGEEKSDEKRVSKEIQEIITEKVETFSQDIIVESVKTRAIGGKRKRYAVKTTFKIPQSLDFDEAIKEDILFALVTKLKAPIELDINLIRYEKL